MPNPKINTLNVNGDAYDLEDSSAVKTVTVNSVTYSPTSGDVDLGTIGGGGTVVYDGDSTADTPYDNLFMDTVASGVGTLIAGAVDYQLLWTNESPSSSFAGQTVFISLSDYDYIGIIFRRTTGSTNNYGTPMYLLKVGTAWYWDELIGGYMVERGVEVTSSSVIFGDSSRLNTYPNGTRTTDNTRQIPYQIYGVRSASVLDTRTKNVLCKRTSKTFNSLAGNTDASLTLDLPSGVTSSNLLSVEIEGYVPSSTWSTTFMVKQINGVTVQYRTNSTTTQNYTIYYRVYYYEEV